MPRSKSESGGPWPDALVTDVQLRAVVAGIRGLGRDGQRVLALAPDRTAAGLSSRFVTAGATGPDAIGDDQGFVETVRRLIARYTPQTAQAMRDGQHDPSPADALVVYPGREKSIDVLSAAWDVMPAGAVLACAEPRILDRLRDKVTLSSLAENAGVNVPRLFAHGPAGDLASARLPVPCVVKLTRSEAVPGATRLVTSADELQGLLRSMPAGATVLIQQPVRGPLVSLAVVISRDGELVERFQQVALRTSPVDAGVSALAMSIAPDEELTERVVRLLGGAGFWGLAQLQFVGAGRKAALIDFNPRFFGSLPLALASGVNLPAAWHAVALGHPVDRPVPYPVGVRYRWLEGDLAAARRGRRSALRPAGSPHVGALWAADDPLPGVILAAAAVRERVKRRRQRRSRR